MKQSLITILRNKNTTISQFHRASEKLGSILAYEISQHIKTEDVVVESPLEKSEGSEIKSQIILVPILRSGVALLGPFIRFFNKAKVGFVGLRRDEKTAVAELYYYKIPKIKSDDTVILLDPMIATGGSAIDALRIIKKAGASEDKILFAAVIAAQEGLDKIKSEFPKVKIEVAQVDKELNDKKYIVPGLGDFGDRYFGTEEAMSI